MDTKDEFDSKAWIDESVTLAARRDRTTKDVQIEKLLRVFTEASHTAYIRKKYFMGVRRQVDESIDMTRDEVAACAKILGVPNPLEDEVQLPPGYVLYHLYGEVAANSMQEPDTTGQIDHPPIAFFRDMSHPNATPMAWVVKGDSMDKVIPNNAIAFGVDFQEAGGVLHNGDMVVVEQILPDGRIERTIKMAKLVDGGIELCPLSHDPQYRVIKMKSLKSSGAEIRIRTLISYHRGNHTRKA